MRFRSWLEGNTPDRVLLFQHGPPPDSNKLHVLLAWADQLPQTDRALLRPIVKSVHAQFRKDRQALQAGRTK